MKNLSAKLAIVLCFCLISWGCEDETLTSSSDMSAASDQSAQLNKKDKAKDSKLLKNVKVDGMLEDGGAFDGKVTITEFSYDKELGLLVSGEIKGIATTAEGVSTHVKQTFENVHTTLTNTSGSASARLSNTQATQATCDILFLDLAPLHLDLLGLTVDLSEVVLDINAVSGSGNLLGNLLCAVVGLLDPAGFLVDLINTLQQLLDLLNQINGIL